MLTIVLHHYPMAVRRNAAGCRTEVSMRCWTARTSGKRMGGQITFSFWILALKLQSSQHLFQYFSIPIDSMRKHWHVINVQVIRDVLCFLEIWDCAFGISCCPGCVHTLIFFDLGMQMHRFRGERARKRYHPQAISHRVLPERVNGITLTRNFRVSYG